MRDTYDKNPNVSPGSANIDRKVNFLKDIQKIRRCLPKKRGSFRVSGFVRSHDNHIAFVSNGTSVDCTITAFKLKPNPFVKRSNNGVLSSLRSK